MRRYDSVPDSSGAVFQVDFYDEQGNSVVPTSVSWSMTDGNETVINSREDVSITPAATVYISLSPDDTAYSDGKKRVIVTTGSYISSLTGQAMTVRDSFWFNIDDLPTV